MRELEIKVPATREADVLEVLQGTCQLKNVTRVSDGVTSIITAYVLHEEIGVMLNELDKVGCGTAYGKIAVLPVLLLKPLPKPSKQERHLTFLVSESTWHRRGRLAIEEMHATVAAGCTASFDFCCLVLVAAWIAAVGLATNNAVMIVASMLVSPLMGPILAFAFGTSIRDWHMVRLGIAVELIGLLVTFLVGFVAGLIVSGWSEVAIGNEWPTGEMSSRGDPHNLIAGVLYAIPSGAGVAFSTTAGGPTAIVGVAIAASLLPPVVNVGMNLAFAIAGAERLGMDATQFYNISAISLALYGINVACIYLVCQLVFFIKDVVPVRKQLSTYKNLPPVTPGVAKKRDGPSASTQGSGGLRLDGLVGEGSGGMLSEGAVSIDMDPVSLKLAQQAATKWRANTAKSKAINSNTSSGTMTTVGSGK